MDPSVFFDHIVSHIEKGLPLAVFRMPHSEEVFAYLQSDLSHQTPETLSEGFLIAPFQSTDAFIAIRNDNIIKTNFAAADSDKVSLIPQWKGIDVKEQLHIGLVNNALQAINRTALNKVVLATSLKLLLTIRCWCILLGFWSVITTLLIFGFHIQFAVLGWGLLQSCCCL